MAGRKRSLTIITAHVDKGGHQTLYRPEFVEQAYNLCLLGAGDKELAKVFGVTASAISKWAKAHEEFAAAIVVGGVHADAKIARSGFERANGYTYTESVAIKVKTGQYSEEVQIVKVEKHVPGDPTLIKFWLTNRQKDLWAESSKIEHSGSIDVTEKPVDEMTDDELFAKIEEAKRSFEISADVLDVIDVSDAMKDMGFD